MKKIIAGILFLTIISGISFAEGQSEQKMDKVQLKLGIWPEESQSAEIESHLLLKAAFEQMYPGIEVIPAFYKYAPDTFMPLAASGELPTVYETWFTEPQKIIDNGFAGDITELVKQYGYDKDMNPAVKELLSKDGVLYGLPRDGYALGMYINMNLFREAGLIDSDGLPLYPKTFEELIYTAGVITEKTGKAGMYIASKDNVGGWHFSNIAWNFGASFTKEVNGKIKSNIASSEVLEAFQYVYDLKWKHGVLLENSLLGWGEWIQNFGTNQVAMVLASPDVIQLPINDYGLDKDSISIVPIPTGPNGDQYSLMGGTPYMFSPNATAEEIDAALKWLQFTGRLGTIDETGLESRRTDLMQKAEAGHPVGPQTLKVWMNKDTNKKIDALYKELENVDMNLFNNYYEVSQYNVRAEESYYAQDLYSILDNVLQQVLNEKGLDIEYLLEIADKEYQNSYLDQIK